MKKVRIIPRLDVKGPNVVKGIHLEGLRVVGNPAQLARQYYLQGADELIYLDIVASLYNRNNLAHIVEETTQQGVFIPITVGGGIRNLEDIEKLLRSGADKVAINTAAIKDPNLLKKAVSVYGSSTITLSVEAKRAGNGRWEAYVDNGREKTGRDVIEWIKEAEDLGVGEVLITSVDQEGTRKGFDLELVSAVTEKVSVPVVVSGGAGNISHIEKCLDNPMVDGIALASVLHYGDLKVNEIKDGLSKTNDTCIKHDHGDSILVRSKNEVEVSILDCNLGNLQSVKNTFKQLGAHFKFITEPQEAVNAQFLVLPGVGAFAEGMKHIRARKLDGAIKEYAQSGRPLLGICLGMQLLMSKSHEFGEHEGLDLIEGQVLPFPIEEEKKRLGYKVPHVGWNTVNAAARWQGTILDGIEDHAEAYFVHSFYVKPKNDNNCLAGTSYFDHSFCSVVCKDNIYGCQFHPEKSGRMGLSLLNNFLSLSARVGV